MRPVPQCALDFLRKHEGCVLRVYDDARPAYVLKIGDDPIGTLTAGYGHTGPELHPGMTVPQEKAEIWLAQDAGKAGRLVEANIGAVVGELTEHQFAALVSFVFNVGADPKWTIWKRLKARQFDQVPLELMKFVNARGKKIQGLVNRRAAEVALWSTDEPGSVPVDLPSSVTRLEDTPPTPFVAKPISRSKRLWLMVTGGVTAGANWAIEHLKVAGDYVQQLQHLVLPQAEHSHLLAKLSSGLAVLSVAVAAACVFLHVQDQKDAKR